ncbi:hypothetical protein EVAR_102421_1 [Eumeta japonica]|uniref:Uncharacterized protein n=1 Tax=Eumeta variegata TaxID=151549 RepID=A0A4C1YVJ4_EUMVA|nr:hypothetical protein EVAR_102421_1 [Eumeta japonica]
MLAVGFEADTTKKGTADALSFLPVLLSNCSPAECVPRAPRPSLHAPRRQTGTQLKLITLLGFRCARGCKLQDGSIPVSLVRRRVSGLFTQMSSQTGWSVRLLGSVTWRPYPRLLDYFSYQMTSIRV